MTEIYDKAWEHLNTTKFFYVNADIGAGIPPRRSYMYYAGNNSNSQVINSRWNYCSSNLRPSVIDKFIVAPKLSNGVYKDLIGTNNIAFNQSYSSEIPKHNHDMSYRIAGQVKKYRTSGDYREVLSNSYYSSDPTDDYRFTVSNNDPEYAASNEDTTPNNIQMNIITNNEDPSINLKTIGHSANDTSGYYPAHYYTTNENNHSVSSTKCIDILDYIIPIGTVIYIYNNSSIDTNMWKECVGGEVSNSDNPEIESVLGTYYGSAGGADYTKIPDCRGLFIRPTDTNTPGKKYKSTVKSHNHTYKHYHKGYNISDTFGGNKRRCIGRTFFTGDGLEQNQFNFTTKKVSTYEHNTSTGTVIGTTSDTDIINNNNNNTMTSETRPPNKALKTYIKVRNNKVTNTSNSNSDAFYFKDSDGNYIEGISAITLPIGSIIPWYGNDDVNNGDIDELPSSWKICDGTNNTPNLQGFFIKCYASAAVTHDVEAANFKYNDQEKSNITINKISASSGNVNIEETHLVGYHTHFQATSWQGWRNVDTTAQTPYILLACQGGSRQGSFANQTGWITTKNDSNTTQPVKPPHTYCRFIMRVS